MPIVFILDPKTRILFNCLVKRVLVQHSWSPMVLQRYNLFLLLFFVYTSKGTPPRKCMPV